MPDTHEDLRRRLFDAAWETPAYAPAAERTVTRARRRAGTTIIGGSLVVILAVVIGASSFELAQEERTAIRPTGTTDDREFLVDVSSGQTTELTEIDAFEQAWWPDVSPDGERIAFTTDATGSPQVYVANLDGSGLRQLTRGLPDVAAPVWSPRATGSPTSVWARARTLSGACTSSTSPRDARGGSRTSRRTRGSLSGPPTVAPSCSS